MHAFINRSLMQSGVQERISGAPAVPVKPTLCSESSNSGSSKLTVHSNHSCVDYKYFDPPLVRAFKSVKNGARHGVSRVRAEISVVSSRTKRNTRSLLSPQTQLSSRQFH